MTEEGTIQFSMEWMNLVVSKNLFFFSKIGFIRQLFSDINLYNMFTLFVDDEIINLVVLETKIKYLS